jgi:hypothetical protein
MKLVLLLAVSQLLNFSAVRCFKSSEQIEGYPLFEHKFGHEVTLPFFDSAEIGKLGPANFQSEGCRIQNRRWPASSLPAFDQSLAGFDSSTVYVNRGNCKLPRSYYLTDKKDASALNWKSALVLLPEDLRKIIDPKFLDQAALPRQSLSRTGRKRNRMEYSDYSSKKIRKINDAYKEGDEEPYPKKKVKEKRLNYHWRSIAHLLGMPQGKLHTILLTSTTFN